MVGTKGPALEEVVREYFAKQGFFALRSVPYRYEGEEVTDIDVWLYSRQAASVRIRAIVDVKNKKSPKAFERILWVKGMQSALKCDRAIIATTDGSPKLVQYAQSQGITVLTKTFLDRLERRLITEDRLTLEQFEAYVQENPAYKQDGDWLRVLDNAKSALASGGHFAAFNKAMLAFKFFAERAEIRAQYRDQAVRCAVLCAALACIALDNALERYMYDSVEVRFASLVEGVTYGDAGNVYSRHSIEAAMSVVTEAMPNGRAIAAQARHHLNDRLNEIRADVVAEYFAREQNAQHLFAAAKELEEVAHTVEISDNWTLSLEARSILGVFADFVNVKRTALPISASKNQAPIIKTIDEGEADPVVKATKTGLDETADMPSQEQRPLL